MATVPEKIKYRGQVYVLKTATTKAAAWESLPKGWDKKSLKSMWRSLTGSRKHKITACMKKVEGHVDNPGAFCASLARKMGAK
jgi:hypothetical protein